jgi:hypothetical protein
MSLNDHFGTAIPRRRFLAALTAAIALPETPVPALARDDLLLLKRGNVERLRLDFNAHRDMVRIVAILSPT